MYRVIRASQEIIPFEDLPIRRSRFHPESAYNLIKHDRDIDYEGLALRIIYDENYKDLDVKIRSIEIASLITDQPFNEVAHLKELYDAAPTISQLQNLSSALPLVIRCQGENYLLDGNTRTNLILALGGKYVKCQFCDFDAAGIKLPDDCRSFVKESESGGKLGWQNQPERRQNEK